MIALKYIRKRVMPMNTMEVLTLLLLVFTVLSYLQNNRDHDNHNKKK